MNGQARIRSILPDQPADRQLAKVGLAERLTWYLLHSVADDHGRFLATAPLVRSQCYPYDDFPAADVASWLEGLQRVGRVKLYEVGGEVYGVLTPWRQRIDRPADSAFPAPPVVEQTALPLAASGAIDERSTNDRRAVVERSPLEQERERYVSMELRSISPEPAAPAGVVEVPGKAISTRVSSGEVEAVWAKWAEGRVRVVLTDDRRRLIAKALKSHGLEVCLDAVVGWRHIAHNRGENPRGKVYDSIDLCLRDAKHIEDFAKAEADARSAPEDVDAAYQAAWRNGQRELDEEAARSMMAAAGGHQGDAGRVATAGASVVVDLEAGQATADRGAAGDVVPLPRAAGRG